jgi:4a-hydroxytetrahydrobiopterin dehydratase
MQYMALADKKCVACEGGTVPLTIPESEILMRQLKEWSLSSDGKTLSKQLSFKNFAQALAFVNEVGAIAESEGHHPDISFGWGKATIALTTHAIGGLSENDFIVASKIDAFPAA